MVEQPVESRYEKPLIKGSNLVEEEVFVFLPMMLTPCGPGKLRFSDDFNNPESGWHTWDTDRSLANYHNGEFRILVKEREANAGLARGDASGLGYLLTADIRNATGHSGQYGLLFGFMGALELDFYTFFIDSSGNFFVYYNEQEVPDPIQRTLLHSDWSAGIRQGMEPNNLAVIHRPSTFYFYANDQLLATLPSDRNGAEQLGMFTRSMQEENLDIRFDNFAVYEFNCDP
jgi:hypothetical protein